jgi:arylsulfatase A-like enzyme
VARSLFHGGFASTLPGAASAPYWLPLLGWLGLTLVLYLLQPLLATGRRRLVLAWLLLGLVVLIELANRRLYTSEYPDLHAFLVIGAVVASAAAVRQMMFVLQVSGRALALPALSLAVILCAGCAVTLKYGMGTQRVRWAMAKQGTHTRHIVRTVRSLSPKRHADPADLDDLLGGHEEAEPAPAPLRKESPPAWVQGAQVAALLSHTRTQNILFLSVDALRADMLVDNPTNRRDFPRLFALLGESRAFRRAYSPAAGTDLAMACLLTGHINPFVPVEQTLAEAIAGTGRRTHGVLPREVLRWAGETLLLRGLHSFDRVITDPHHRDVGSHTTSRQTTDLGLAFLDQHAAAHRDRPFFLWLHYFDVHEHDQVQSRDAALREVLGGRPRSRVQKYRGLLQVVDREIGRLMDQLRTRGLLDHTLVVLFSDHGESLGEDERFPENHGHYVYNTLVHVPLALRIPGVAPAAIDTPVSLIDLMPTLLSLTGAKVPPAVDGITLLPFFIDGDAALAMPKDRPIVMNESEQYALLMWPHKLLVRPADRLIELYDLDRDPAERNDLSESLPHKVRELNRLYRRFPRVLMDRTPRGRRYREAVAQPPTPEP